MHGELNCHYHTLIFKRTEMFHNVHVRNGFKIYALMPKERKLYVHMCDLNFKSHELSYQSATKKIKIL